MLNLVIFGPPGSGKGTQSVKIAEKYNLAHISTGDIFRAEIKEQTELGLKVKSIIEKGELVPDELLIDLLRSAMDKSPGQNGFIFDGFPRTTRQAMDLEQLMKQRNNGISLVLALDVDDSEIIRRLLKRAEIEGRKDDTEEVIKNRLSVYNEQTMPLLNFYEQTDKLVKINGVGSIEEIFSSACQQIDRI